MTIAGRFYKGQPAGPGRKKGPDKVKLSGYITKETANRLKVLVNETGWCQGELVDMLIGRANSKNLKRKGK